jgi:hypothetical protein
MLGGWKSLVCTHPTHVHLLPSTTVNVLTDTSISLPGCLRPCISTGIMMYFRFMHSQEGRLNIHRVKGHVLWLLPHSLNGFIPSVLKPNLMFLASLSKSRNSLSMFHHCDPSGGCLSIWSYLQSSLCHRINFACALFLSKRFKRCIIGKYHITLAGIFSVGRLPVEITWIILPDLISLCATNKTNTQFLIFVAAIEDTVRTSVNLLYIQSKRANNLFCFLCCRG